ncbi:hypothetical protein DL96DRAFT_1684726 [Flagelloscypha sp. PMI_526]|nr:hypothetical protein DL96DRAFT_1684726 [Flagelloscypha sp. PMI_526]
MRVLVSTPEDSEIRKIENLLILFSEAWSAELEFGNAWIEELILQRRVLSQKIGKHLLSRLKSIQTSKKTWNEYIIKYLSGLLPFAKLLADGGKLPKDPNGTTFMSCSGVFVEMCRDHAPKAEISKSEFSESLTWSKLTLGVSGAIAQWLIVAHSRIVLNFRIYIVPWSSTPSANAKLLQDLLFYLKGMWFNMFHGAAFEGCVGQESLTISDSVECMKLDSLKVGAIFGKDDNADERPAT